MSFITRLEELASDLYSVAVEHDQLVSVHAERPDGRWVDAYNLVVSAIVALERDDTVNLEVNRRYCKRHDIFDCPFD